MKVQYRATPVLEYNRAFSTLTSYSKLNDVIEKTQGFLKGNKNKHECTLARLQSLALITTCTKITDYKMMLGELWSIVVHGIFQDTLMKNVFSFLDIERRDVTAIAYIMLICI